jgi:hypothetical protein
MHDMCDAVEVLVDTSCFSLLNMQREWKKSTSTFRSGLSKFLTYLSKKTGMTKIFIQSISESVVAHLTAE